jgi:hypothetical protein
VNGSYPAEDIDTDFSMDDVINRIYRR